MATVLVVDDSVVECHRAGALLEKSTGVKVVYAANGREALDAMQHSLPDLVLTDMQMPVMDGLELVEQVRATYPAVPVVLMTAHGSEDIAAQALKRGAASYVPKRDLAQDLVETVEGVLSLTRAAREQERILECLTEGGSRFLLANDLALVNAIEHGNLEVPSALKETDERAFHTLIEERRRTPPYRDRRVHVVSRESPVEAVYTIRDEGPGFNPADLPDPTDPANLEKVSGRGLLLIRTFMDEVCHNETGNEITLVKRVDR